MYFLLQTSKFPFYHEICKGKNILKSLLKRILKRYGRNFQCESSFNNFCHYVYLRFYLDLMASFTCNILYSNNNNKKKQRERVSKKLFLCVCNFKKWMYGNIFIIVTKIHRCEFWRKFAHYKVILDFLHFIYVYDFRSRFAFKQLYTCVKHRINVILINVTYIAKRKFNPENRSQEKQSYF